MEEIKGMKGMLSQDGTVEPLTAQPQMESRKKKRGTLNAVRVKGNQKEIFESELLKGEGAKMTSSMAQTSPSEIVRVEGNNGCDQNKASELDQKLLVLLEGGVAQKVGKKVEEAKNQPVRKLESETSKRIENIEGEIGEEKTGGEERRAKLENKEVQLDQENTKKSKDFSEGIVRKEESIPLNKEKGEEETVVTNAVIEVNVEDVKAVHAGLIEPKGDVTGKETEKDAVEAGTAKVLVDDLFKKVEMKVVEDIALPTLNNVEQIIFEKNNSWERREDGKAEAMEAFDNGGSRDNAWEGEREEDENIPEIGKDICEPKSGGESMISATTSKGSFTYVRDISMGVEAGAEAQAWWYVSSDYHRNWGMTQSDSITSVSREGGQIGKGETEWDWELL